jgi:peptide/nickel transport system permease protein
LPSVLGYALRRLGAGIITLWVVSVLVFAGTEMLSGDAASAILGQTATPQSLAVVRDQLGLDRPAYERYASWIGGVVHGDFGRSLAVGSGGAVGSRGGVPVSTIIGDRLVNTLILTLLAALLTVPLGIALGIWSAIKPGSLIDSTISATTLGLIALPEFVTGSVLVLLFAIAWPLFPAVSVIGGADSIGSRIDALVLPVAALGAASIAQTSRMIRGSMIEALESDYVQMARLKGIPERRVVFRHALRNALVPTIQVIALTVAWLVGGVVVVEVVFDYPGIGQALANAVSTRDIPVVQALSLVIAAVYVVVNLAADLATIMLTPKLRRT